MMKNAICLVLAVLLSAPAFAANVSQKKVVAKNAEASSATASSLRLLGGMGFSTLSNTAMLSGPGVDIKSRTGMSLALEMDLPFSEIFSFSTGLNYVQKGITMNADFKPLGLDASAKANVNMNYLQIPAMLNGNLMLGDSSRIGLGVGPYMAFALSRSVSGTVTQAGQTTDIDPNSVKGVSDSISSTDFGGRFALTFDTSLTEDLLFVAGAKYDLGLKNVSTSNVATDNTKTRSFIANVGIGMKI